MLAISLGGVYETQFGDSYYELLWKNRMNFAKVALDSKKILPFFYKIPSRSFQNHELRLENVAKNLHTFTRFFFAPIYGGFPVKLITYVGKPITLSHDLTPEQVKEEVAIRLRSLIKQHQPIPGSITRGLLERVYRN